MKEQAFEDILYNFKTSYVEVYQVTLLAPCPCSRISKHLMLKFIAPSGLYRCLLDYFKTSYVEVYLFIRVIPDAFNEISKHLMLKFIYV